MMATNVPTVPVYQEYMNPILDVLRAADSSLENGEIVEQVADQMELPPAVRDIPHGETASSEVAYRIAWAKTYLKKAGYIENPSRGRWSLTQKGEATTTVEPSTVVNEVREGAEPERRSAELSENQQEELLAIRDQLIEEGALPKIEVLERAYETFRERFGPSVLRELDGEELLLRIHERKTHDSLVYWLEFKDDDDFPRIFGGIGGGSALKFGMYHSSSTGHWMSGHPNKQVRLTLQQAIDRARKDRDQLVAGAALLEDAGRNPEEIDYEELGTKMMEVAPDLADTAWGHKYFSLMAPTTIDAFHAIQFQKFHLYRLGKLPTNDRYRNGGFLAAIAHRLGIPLVHLGRVLLKKDGHPPMYWRIGTQPVEHRESRWKEMLANGIIGVGWENTGSLEEIDNSAEGRDKLRALLEEHHPANKATVTKQTSQLFQFLHKIKEGDRVVAMQGATVLGVGVVTGPYIYSEDTPDFPHQRPVDWLDTSEWKLPQIEGIRNTVKELHRHPQNLLEIEERVRLPDTVEIPSQAGKERKPRRPISAVPEHVRRIDAALKRKSQVILYGPPGTGKTYWAQEAAQELTARAWFKRDYESLSHAERATLVERGAIAHCCFHPAYGYEDFLAGYRPTKTNAGVAFEVRDGVFTQACARASSDTSDRPYFLIIDEINRGDIPRIFGELLTVLEHDKRGRAITLSVDARELVVPKNLFIIGTMNTADRSVALLDAALRRRFAFIELMPNPKVLGDAGIEGLPLGLWLKRLNDKVLEHAGRDARNLQIGHSYLMRGTKPIANLDRFAEVFREEIIPLLQEYCYEDYATLEKILGEAFVDGKRQELNERIFDPAQRLELMDAIKGQFPELTATEAAASSEADEGTEDDAEDQGDEASEEELG